MDLGIEPSTTQADSDRGSPSPVLEELAEHRPGASRGQRPIQASGHIDNPRPKGGSWLNAVEGFFATLTKRRLRRGTFLGAVVNFFEGAEAGDLVTNVER